MAINFGTDFQKASDRIAMAAKIVRDGGVYSELNKGKINIYKVFVERAFQLLKPNGVLGLLVPSGIASDQSSSGFFRKVSSGKRIKTIIDFFNRKRDGNLFFPDVYYRYKFCAYVVGADDRHFDTATFGFFIRDVAEIADPNRVFPITDQEICAINPNTGTAPIFRSRRDKEISAKIYSLNPVLVDRSSSDVRASWPVSFSQMVNMSSNSASFRNMSELTDGEGAWPIANNRYDPAMMSGFPYMKGKWFSRMITGLQI